MTTFTAHNSKFTIEQQGFVKFHAEAELEAIKNEIIRHFQVSAAKVVDAATDDDLEMVAAGIARDVFPQYDGDKFGVTLSRVA